MEFKDFKELINTKLDKLTWINYDDSSIISEEGFTITLDYYKNIGENKDKNQLLVNVYYKTINVSVVASTDPESCENFSKWYFGKVKIVDENNEIEAELLRKKGEQIFKDL
tara:strand:- start:887 stop:1219 length:333 start_codon:yes stop_codon:yes gene_type:complete